MNIYIDIFPMNTYKLKRGMISLNFAWFKMKQNWDKSLNGFYKLKIFNHMNRGLTCTGGMRHRIIPVLISSRRL